MSGEVWWGKEGGRCSVEHQKEWGTCQQALEGDSVGNNFIEKTDE